MERRVAERGLILGCWDLFHYGHLKAIQKATSLCYHLTVGIYSNKCVQDYKYKRPIMSTYERLTIIEAIRGVDAVVILNERPANSVEFNVFDVIFLGDQWINTPRNKLPMIPKKFYGQIIYIPYTEGISTSEIKEWIKNES